MKKKIFYYMHVPWGWIKQRPHFIAEHLDQYYDVNVNYERPYKTRQHQKTRSHLKISELNRLPFDRFQMVANFNNFLINLQVRRKVLEADYLWITDPRMFGRIARLPFGNNKVKIIYDCMDDIAEFPCLKFSPRLPQLLQDEKEMINRSAITYVSSATLKERILKRHAIKDFEKIHLINNAFEPKAFRDQTVELASSPSHFAASHSMFTKTAVYQKMLAAKNSQLKIISFFGTIANWFNFKLILNSLEQNPAITYFLFGPLDTKIPHHPRLCYGGVLEHNLIHSAMKNSDLLIMPFEVNQLIESVDPIKMYEYIASGVSTIMPRYSETQKFENFLNLYSSEKEYFDQINSPPKMIQKKLLEEFTYRHCWENRVEQIIQHLHENLT